MSKRVEDRSDLLELLEKIYDGPKEQAYYNFMKLNFTEKEIGHYYIKQYGENQKITLIKEWFKQGRSLRKLCEIIADTYSTQDAYSKAISEFIDALIQCKIHVENKELKDPTEFNSAYQSTPDTVDSQFAKFFGQMIGLKNYYVDKYIPIEELITVCVKVFGEECNVEIMFEEAIDKMNNNKDTKYKDEIYESLNEIDENQHKLKSKEGYKYYEHVDFYTLCEWKKGETVHPNLESDLFLTVERLKEFGEDMIRDYPEEYKTTKKLTELSDFTQFLGKRITHIRMFKEDDLDNILSAQFARDSVLGSVIIGLSILEVNYVTESLVRGLCLNFELLKFYVDKLYKQ